MQQETKTPVESAIESAKKTCDDGTTVNLDYDLSTESPSSLRSSRS